MQSRSTGGTRASVLFTLFVLSLITAIAILPFGFRAKAGGEGLLSRTVSYEDRYPNYDIRSEKSDEVATAMDRYRLGAGKDGSEVGRVKNGFVRGEEALRTSVPTLKVEYNPVSNNPEVITPDVNSPGSLTAPSSGVKRSEILRNFIRENDSLIGVDDSQADALKVTADYTNPDGVLSYAHLEQFINNVPVFQGEIKAGFNKRGAMFRVINNLAPGLDYGSLPTDFGDPVDAVNAAFKNVSRPMTSEDTTKNNAASDDLKVVFGSGDWATTAEKMYFPTEPGVAVPAWRVMIWQPVNAYYVIVDAHTGSMLWRKNLTNDQTQQATYEVYQAPTSFLGAAGNPAPMSPGPLDPTAGTQGAIGTRTNNTRIGNEAPFTFNNLGWITDAGNITDGNAVEAGLDVVTPNGVDPGSHATGSPTRVFTSLWNPPPGSPAPGDVPSAAEARRGAVIQMFYVMNRYHDELYRFGFTEAARNFQNDNFGRNPGGGTANAIAGVDRVSAEGQDSSGTNNANFSAGADGVRGRMQMFLWTGPDPDRDGTGDGEVIIHEVTHGTSQRLHNNNAGLTANMSGGMGEGWGDFYGHTMLARSGEPLDSTNALGGYALLQGFGVVGTANYYYGIRRFPKARISFTGGPLNRPHNPMTFADIDSTQINVTNGAFAAMAGPHISTTADQVHAAGEIWSSTLWEVRCLMVGRLGFTTGSEKVLQYVTDGMKLDPVNPTFLQGRDSIIQSALNSADPGSVGDIREGFRLRGMGFTASIQSGNGTPARVTERFDKAMTNFVDPFSVTPVPIGDTFPEPGETVNLSVAINNISGNLVTGVTATVVGGGTANYGDIANGATVVRDISYTIPAGAACGSMHQVTINGSGTIAGDPTPSDMVPFIKSFRLGAPIGGAPASFTNSTPINMPQGQPATTSGPAGPYPSNITVSGLTGNKVMKITFNGYHHEFEDDLDFLLVGPGGQKMLIVSDTGGITEQLSPITFHLADNGTLLLPDATGYVNGTTYRPSNVGISATDDQFNAPAPVPPYENPAPAGSATFASVFGTNGTNLNGTWSLYIDDDAGQDWGIMDGGWTMTFEANDFACDPDVVIPDVRADFDGDGRTDRSVYRASEGNWYLSRSTDGFAAIHWGLASDTIVPGDYDADGKTDTAVFRPAASIVESDYFILQSNGFVVTTVPWGLPNDIPLSGDYDGDGKTDVTVFRPSDNVFYTKRSSDGAVASAVFGSSGDIPLAIDNDGDGRTNLAVFRPSNNTWYIARPTGVPAVNFDAIPFGLSTDLFAPADYDGDNKDDIAVFRPSNGTWYVLRSTNGLVDFTVFGQNGDIPVPGDYDGDGSDDRAVYRAGTWHVLQSTSGYVGTPFGIALDKPVPKAYIP